MAFLPGWKRPFEKEAWLDDPHLLVQIVEPKSSKGKPSVEPLGIPNPTSPADVHARNWRRIYRAVLQCFTPPICNALHTEVACSRRFLREVTQKHPTTLLCSGPAANKALYQDAAHLAIRLPKDALTGRSAAEAIRELDWLRDIDLRRILREALPSQAQERPGIVASLAAAAVKGETCLRAHFNNLLTGLASSVPNALDQWRKNAEESLTDVLREALHVIGKGSVLRRREQEATAEAALVRAVSPVNPDNKN
jgi:hypothetical protein